MPTINDDDFTLADDGTLRFKLRVTAHLGEGERAHPRAAIDLALTRLQHDDFDVELVAAGGDRVDEALELHQLLFGPGAQARTDPDRLRGFLAAVEALYGARTRDRIATELASRDSRHSGGSGARDLSSTADGTTAGNDG